MIRTRGAASPIKRWALDLLACPRCGGALGETGDGPALRCVDCAVLYPVRSGVPRFVADDAYARSFSFEWKIHARTQLDDDASHESEETFRQKTGLAPADVDGRTVLDVGCGMGRFSDVVSRWGGRVLAVDLSYAVDSAQANLGDRPNVQVLQADLFRLPLKDEAFDIVFSVGVLHHAPDCRRAFLALPRLVKPGGTLAVWVYQLGGVGERISDLYRRVTTRLPARLLYALCRLAVPLYHVHRMPVVGQITQRLLLTSMHPRSEWRVLDTFDWYAARHQSKHTYPEVFGWFRAARFVDVELLEVPVAMRGKKPAEG